ncbi:response regulator transcription factor, partial [bacterium]|nr:response regulator transcription factor [bacterium]
LKSEQLKQSLKFLKSEFNLTDREVDILQSISEGYSNPEIAKKLFLSVNTIKYHTRNLYQKLDINNRTQAILEVEKCYNN